ncbi:MAG: BspA family leucine-rich repeat surface protein, partial [Clostridiales bacterium]|nr:BspA family leucine-rich repeat surface protein [Clostridiales bacterium]
FDTGNVKSTYEMFYDCSGLTELGVSVLDTAKVEDMNSMFYNCSGLTELDVSDFDTGNVTTMDYMFYGCSGLRTLDLGNFDTGKLGKHGRTSNLSTYDMFTGCTGLTEVTLGENFAFGATDEDYRLPTPDPEYIEEADGYWYNTAGEAYLATEIPDYTADTYYAIPHDDVPMTVDYEITPDEVTVGIVLTPSEDGTISYMVSTDGSIDQDSFENKIKDSEKGMTATLEANEGEDIDFTVSGLSVNTTYFLYLMTEDDMGNIGFYCVSSDEGLTFTTLKGTTAAGVLPTASGIYGTSIYDMELVGGTAVCEADGETVSGTWSFASGILADTPTVKESSENTYTVEFTPGSDDYIGFTTSIDVTVEPKSVTVVLDDIEMAYGDSVPELTWSLKEENDLVEGDTEDDLNIVLSVDADENSDLGTYPISAEYDNANYDVTFTGANLTIAEKSLEDSDVTITLDSDAYYYTSKDITPAVTVTINGTELVSETDYSVSYDSNVNVGTGEVTITGSGNYTGTVTLDFTISYIDSPGWTAEGALSTVNGYTDWYTTPVTLTPEEEGWQLCRDTYDNWQDEITIDTQGENELSIGMLQNETGYLTEFEEITLKIDSEAPAFESAETGIAIKNNWFKTLLNKITFGLLFNEDVTVTISAEDAASGVAGYYYYIDYSGSETALTAAELENVEFNYSKNGKFTLGDEDSYVVYAYAVDNVGNQSDYICSDGFIIDRTPMTVEVSVEAEEYTAGITFTSDENGTISYLVSSDVKLSEDDLETGNATTIEMEADTSITETVSDLTPNTQYYIYAITEDEAGNLEFVVIDTFNTAAHSMTYHEKVDASCTEDGMEAYYICRTCGEIYTDADGENETSEDELIIAAAGHDYQAKITQPTCTAYGYTNHTCENCGDTWYSDYEAALGHDWDDGVITKVAMYDTTGEMTYTCQTCGETYVDEIPATGEHYWDAGEIVKEPACTEIGEIKYTCTVCGTEYTVTIPATGHDYVVSEVVAASCTSRGYTVYICENCGDTYRDNYTDRGDHTWDEGTMTTAPTCVKEGVMTYTCTACGRTYTETIPATGEHSWKAESTVSATCTEDGYTIYICETCGDSYTGDHVVAAGHRWDDGVVTKEPTETEEGEATYTCTVCGETYTDPIPTTGEHTWDDGTVTEEATCTEMGEKTFTCSGCGETYTVEIPATGHSYDDGVVTEEATCTTDGVKTYTCSNCGVTYTEGIPATGHDFAEGVVTEPTCTEEGYTTHSCKNCDYSYADDHKDATGHDWDEGVTTVEPTCLTSGEYTYTCKTCQETYTETILALGHNYHKQVTAPTCTTAGYTTYICVNDGCEESYVGDHVRATGHSWDEGVVTKEATDEENGVKTYTCENCGETYTEDIPAYGHEWDEGTVTKEPTCTEMGEMTYKCTDEDCTAEYTVKIPATGHKYDSYVTPVTCTTAGYVTYICKYCGDTYTDSHVDATGHSWVKEETDESGLITYICEKCGITWTVSSTDTNGDLTVKSSGNVSGATVVIDEPEALLTNNEKTLIAVYDGSVDIVLNINTVDPEEVNEDEEALIWGAIKGHGGTEDTARVHYLDITMDKLIYDASETLESNVHMSGIFDTDITITIPVPDNLAEFAAESDGEFYVVRIHDGEAGILETT